MIHYYFEQVSYTNVQQQMEGCTEQLMKEVSIKRLSKKYQQLNYAKAQLLSEIELLINLYPIWTKQSRDAAKRLEKWRTQYKTKDTTLKVKGIEQEISKKIGGIDIFGKLMLSGNDFELREVQKQFRQASNIRAIKVSYLENLLQYAVGYVITSDAYSITVTSEFEQVQIAVANDFFFTQFHNDLIGNKKAIKLNQRLLDTILMSIMFIKDEEFEAIRSSIAAFLKEELDFKGLIEIIGKELQNRKCVLK